MFRTVPLSIIRNSFTVHSAVVYVIHVCRQLSSRIRMELRFHPDPAQKLSTNMYDTYHCWVYSEWTPDDGQRHCPKHVEFHVKNKFAKLVHPVGLIIKKFVTMHGHMNVEYKKVYELHSSTLMKNNSFRMASHMTINVARLPLTSQLLKKKSSSW
jgi:hypothetical protein